MYLIKGKLSGIPLLRIGYSLYYPRLPKYQWYHVTTAKYIYFKYLLMYYF